jgi:hypothetical protein
MVWYFSFDQGRQTQKYRIEELGKAVEAKDRIITRMAAEIARLKEQAVESPEGDSEKVSGPSEASRVTVRLDSSRTLLGGRLVVACLDIDQPGKKAVLRLNLLDRGAIVNETVGLGQAIRFSIGDRPMILVLEQIHASQVSVSIVPDPGAATGGA